MTSLARKIAVVLVVLLVLLALTLSLSQVSTRHDMSQTDSTAQLEHLPVSAPPPVTAHMKQVVAESRGFSAFISYTDNGFEPTDVAISRGQSVRFTNNSSRTMWITSVGGESGVYPAAPESCGQSALDTCIALPPHEIWEFTFGIAGNWSYRNSTHTVDTGIIRVK